MRQKYKFFIKDRVVIIEEVRDVQADLESVNRKVLEALSSDANHPSILMFQTSNATAVLTHIKDSMRFIQAGGGYVSDESGRVLMIFRRGFWDLPKGKMDPGETIEETALREVQEECGVEHLQIASTPFSTFHLYEERGEMILKESVWYRMNTKHQSLIPQSEEDITQAEWVTLPVPEAITSSCYPSIIEVLEHFSAED